MEAIDEAGVQRMCRNALTLKQTLGSITSSREVALDQTITFYEMFYKDPQVGRSGRGTGIFHLLLTHIFIWSDPPGNPHANHRARRQLHGTAVPERTAAGVQVEGHHRSEHDRLLSAAALRHTRHEGTAAGRCAIGPAGRREMSASTRVCVQVAIATQINRYIIYSANNTNYNGKKCTYEHIRNIY